MLMLAALAACATPDKEPATNGMTDTVKPLQVDRVRVQLSTAFTPGSTDLPVAEAARLESFLDQAHLHANDHVYVAAPPGDAFAQRRVARIARLLAQRGVGIESVAAPPSGVEPNHLLIQVDRYVAQAPPCPDWSDSPETPHTNTPGSNFGCATMTDLSLMVDNPRDLMVGRTMGLPQGDEALGAEQRFRANQVKPFLGGGSSSTSSSSSSSGSSSSSPTSGGGSTTGQ
jgi:pilus assembly protein CpaD